MKTSKKILCCAVVALISTVFPQPVDAGRNMSPADDGARFAAVSSGIEIAGRSVMVRRAVFFFGTVGRLTGFSPALQLAVMGLPPQSAKSPLDGVIVNRSSRGPRGPYIYKDPWPTPPPHDMDRVKNPFITPHYRDAKFGINQ